MVGRSQIRFTLALALSICPLCACDGNDPKAAAAANQPFQLRAIAGPTSSTVNVLTQHNNVSRDGHNPNETLLHPSVVNNASFGELWRWPVDGQISGQPLYVGNYRAANEASTKNLLIVATLNNTIYAFDADSPSQRPIWVTHLMEPYTPPRLPPFPEPVPHNEIVNNKPTGHNAAGVGILSTPVIDVTAPVPGKPQPGRVYAVQMFGADGHEDFQLVALSLYDGSVIPKETFLSPPMGQISELRAGHFIPTQTLNRPALLLSSGSIYVAFGSRYEDNDHHPEYHGYVVRFSAATGGYHGYYRTTPVTGNALNGGGVWQAGRGLAADDSGDIYFTTGNGDYSVGTYCRPSVNTSYEIQPGRVDNCNLPIFKQDGAPAGRPRQDENSIVKLSANLAKIGSYAPWTPMDENGVAKWTPENDPLNQLGKNFQTLEACDGDFGASGPLLINQNGRRRLVVGGKAGQIFSLDPTQMRRSQGTNGRAPMSQPAFQASWNQNLIAGQSAFTPRPALPTAPFDLGYANSNLQCYDKTFDWGPHIHGGPVYFDGVNTDYLFVWGERDYPRRFRVFNGNIIKSPVLINNAVYLSAYTDSLPPDGMPGGAMSISSNQGDVFSGILWALAPSKGSCGENTQCDTIFPGQRGMVTGDLMAFRVSDLQMLWSTRNFHAATSPDFSGGVGISPMIRNYTKFVAPTVANGKVFVSTSSFSVNVYGRRTLRSDHLSNGSGFEWTDCAAAASSDTDLRAGDVNGDGVSDLICHVKKGTAAGTIGVAYGAPNSTAFPLKTWASQVHWCYVSARTPKPQFDVGDFDGDGRTDLFCHDASTGRDYISYSDGADLPYTRELEPPYTIGADWTNAQTAKASWCNRRNGLDHIVIGDYNGDGRSDLLCHNKGLPVTIEIRLAMADDLRFPPGTTQVFRFPRVSWSSAKVSGGFNWCFDTGKIAGRTWYNKLLAGDIDGDGLDDLLCHRPSDGFKFIAFNKWNRRDKKQQWVDTSLEVAASSPRTPEGYEPFFTATDWLFPLGWCKDFDHRGNYLNQFRLADVNGDGADDMVCHNVSADVGKSYVMYAHRRSRGEPHACDTAPPFRQPFSCTTDWTRPTAWCQAGPASLPTLLLADLDGDHRSDFVCHEPAAGLSRIDYYPLAGMPP